MMTNGLTGLTANTKEYRFIEKTHLKNNTFDTERASRKFSDLLADSGADRGKVDLKKLDAKDREIYDNCIEMESFLWKQVLNSMKQTINKHKLIDGGQTEQIFTDFLYDEYSMMMAKKSGTGISDTLFKQLSGYRT